MDWVELNPDLLRHIAKKVGDISNFIRLRAVCKQWRSAIHPSGQPSQLPFYIEFKPNAESSFDLQFFSLYSNRTYTLPITKAKREQLIGSSSRYIFVRHNEYWNSNCCTFGTFVNPITGSEVSVPFGCLIHPFHIGFGSNSNLGSAKNELHVLCYSRDILSLVVPMDKLCLWHYVEGGCWTRISDIQRNFDENIFYNGRSFIFPQQPTMVVDVTTGTLMSVCSDQCPQFSYLIDAGGDLLGVKLFNLDINGNNNIEVYRLESTGKDYCWIKLNDGIGDRVIILDSRHGFCFNASDFDGFEGNCIYFNGYYYIKDNHCQYGIIRYDMKSS